MQSDRSAAIARAQRFVFDTEKAAGLSLPATVHIRTLLALLGSPFVHPAFELPGAMAARLPLADDADFTDEG